jgi:hypothetical protein
MELDLRAEYRLLFLRSTLGKDVLGDILKECHFGCTLDPDNKVQVSEYNVGIMILNKLGIFSEDTGNDVITALANVSPKD